MYRVLHTAKNGGGGEIGAKELCYAQKLYLYFPVYGVVGLCRDIIRLYTVYRARI
jgi:hypothetical protein